MGVRNLPTSRVTSLTPLCRNRAKFSTSSSKASRQPPCSPRSRRRSCQQARFSIRGRCCEGHTSACISAHAPPFARANAAVDLADRTQRAVIVLDSGTNGDYWVVSEAAAKCPESVEKQPLCLAVAGAAASRPLRYRQKYRHLSLLSGRRLNGPSPCLRNRHILRWRLHRTEGP